MSTLIVPPELPSPLDDAKKLHKAFKGFGCDSSAVINILAYRNASQRPLLEKEYRTKYNEELNKRISSELSGNLKKAVLLWMPDPVRRDAIVLQEAFSTNIDLKAATEVLCSRTPSQLLHLKQVYLGLFGVYLEQDIQSQTSGDHEKLLLAYLSIPRSEFPEFDRTMAEHDAQALYKAGEKRWGTDESTFRSIFTQRSRAHLAGVTSAYKTMYGHSLTKAIKNETSGYFEQALLTIVRCAVNPGKYFAKHLAHINFHQVLCQAKAYFVVVNFASYTRIVEVLRKAMHGLGTDDKTLIRVIVTRTEIDMQYIKAEYHKKYDRSLKDDVHSETSGNYRTFLLSLLGPD